MIEIRDPVAGLRYILDTVNRVAHRSVLMPPSDDGGVEASELENGVAPRSALMPPPQTNRAAPDGGFFSSSSGVGRRAQRSPNQIPERSSQSLGTQVIEGGLVEGNLTKITYPAGMMGNDRPIIATSEVWESLDLKVIVLMKSFDPRTGEHVTRLTNINRAEPDPTLFQVPPDYQIVDETGPFTIKITRP